MERADKKYFYIETSPDKLNAEIYCTDEYNERKVTIDRALIDELLLDNNLKSGIVENNIKLLLTTPPASKFPITIAKGIPAQNGEHGKLIYEFNFSSEVQKTDDWNFRDVMRIPSVQKGQKLATIVPPTKGKNGIDVFGNTIRAKQGKPVLMRAGKNVIYNESDMSFYATLEGQASAHHQVIEVQPVFEVHDSLSMETGNLNFVGSIIIHGDIPTGYTVEAEGDVKIYGIVEAATVISGGSIYVSEGLSGLQKGSLKAAHNIHVGYINQGIVHAGETIYVENSILHSECEANKDIYCQRGNIIGGTLSAGQTIEAKDIGNRLSTKTEISLGISQTANEQEQKLLAKKEELIATLSNLKMIGEKLKLQDSQNKQIQLTLRRQQNSYKQTSEQLDKVKTALLQLNSSLGDEKSAELIVNNYIYPNTVISFGKYKRMIQTDHRNVHIFLNKNEITVHTLS